MEKEETKIKIGKENDCLQIGVLTLSSRYYLLPDLINFAREILEDKDLRKLIMLENIKQTTNSYTG